MEHIAQYMTASFTEYLQHQLATCTIDGTYTPITSVRVIPRRSDAHTCAISVWITIFKE